MKRRNLVIATILSLSIAMLTACGGSEESKETTSKKANVTQTATVPQGMIPTEEEDSSKETTTEETKTEEPTTEEEKEIYKLSKETYVNTETGREFINSEYKYDSKGNLIEQYEDGVLVYEYKYDSTGKLYKEVYYASFEYMTMYEYDDDGNLLKDSYYVDGHLKSETEYGSNGEKKLTKAYARHGTYEKDIVITTTYTYDSNNNLLMSYEAVDDGEHIETVQYEYDYNGNLISKNEEGTGHATYIHDYNYEHTYEYEYDDNGNLVKEKIEKVSKNYGIKTANAYNTTDTYEYEYSSTGKLTKKNTHTVSRDTEGNISYNYNYASTYEYDNNGNLVKEIEERIKGNNIYSYTYEYSYDENGNIIMKTLVASDDSNAVINGYAKYEYVTFTEE